MTARMSSICASSVGGCRCVDPIGEAGAAAVKDDDPRERPEAPQAAGERLDAPHVLDVGGEARDEHEVERPVAEDLVGEMRPRPAS